MASKECCKANVLKYLKEQNRPYSINDIIQNLRSEFGKTAVQKALDDLTLELKVKEKVYGKQRVYVVIQENESICGGGENEIQQLDSRVGELNEKLKIVEQELKKNEILLKELESQPLTESAIHEEKEMEKSIEALNQKINELSDSSVAISEEENHKIYSEYENFKSECRKRKRICMDIVHSILENYPKKMKTLFDEIGIDTDHEDFR